MEEESDMDELVEKKKERDQKKGTERRVDACEREREMKCGGRGMWEEKRTLREQKK